MKKKKVGIIGATGYTGVVLIKLLLKHPEIEITYISSEQHINKQYSEIYWNFFESFNLKCNPIDINLISKNCDLVFSATPNDFAKEFIPKLLSQNPNIKVIDLSADFRLEDSININNKKTGIQYGLPEIHRNEIKSSQIIANPGCYPTSVILGLAPLIKNNLIDLNSIIIDSKSGVSGAGRHAKTELQFCEINESFSPYNLGGKHRHIPEIERELSFLADEQNLKITFSPHLLPINRGILSTIYCEQKNKTKISQNKIHLLYTGFYKNEHFIKVLPKDIYPNTKNVRYTNYCHIYPLVDSRTNKIIIVSTIDNMVKGASGQAIQNMNILFSFDEKLALEGIGEIP